MNAPVLAPAGGAVVEDVIGSVLGEMAGSMLGGGGCVPDFLGLVEPIAALIPQPLQPGLGLNAAVRAQLLGTLQSLSCSHLITSFL